jgi:hypothetical protein
MRKRKKKQDPIEVFLAFSDVKKEKAVAEFDRPGRPKGFRPLNAKQRAQ